MLQLYEYKLYNFAILYYLIVFPEIVMACEAHQLVQTTLTGIRYGVTTSLLVQVKLPVKLVLKFSNSCK